MDAAGYATLNRQSGLMREMGVVANNIANSSTTGFRREGVVFSEYVATLGQDPSLSMAHASGRSVDLSQSTIAQTGGQFDFAIQGDGFFLIDTPQGQRLTRAGSFTPNDAGELVTPDGYRLLDEVALSAKEQSLGIGQIGQSIQDLDRATQQNAALVEESAAAAESLKHQAANLAEVVAVFKLSN